MATATCRLGKGSMGQSGRFSGLSMLFVVLLNLWACSPQSSDSLRAVKGEKAPPFTLKSVKGEPVSLASAEGKVVMVEFWATWCAPCRESLPGASRLYEKYRDQGLAVFAVAVQENAATVKSFVDAEGLTMPVLIDDGVVSNIYSVRTIPATFFINRKGILVSELEGYKPGVEPEIENKVKQLLAEQG